VLLKALAVFSRLVSWSFLAALLVSSGCAFEEVPSSGAPIRSPSRYAGKAPPAVPVRTIVLDPGHGGHDPGTAHYGLKEKFLVLDMSRRVRANLQQAGYNVVMTRDADQFIPLSRRPATANRIRADIFVSIHVNANKSSRISGAEVYYPRLSTVGKTSAWPPSVTAAEVGLGSSTVRQILWDLVLTRTRFQSRRLAATLCRSLRDGLGVPCRAVKPARFVVLREAWMPAVLVEVGYVTNSVEASRLAKAEYRAAAARAISNGVLSYVRSLGVEHI
jgi:N-acetylmuramoyl-L-alanine amidase